MFQNEYLLDMDLKFVPSFPPPRFRRGDTAILKFRLHDNGIMFDASEYDKAEITVEMPSKVKLVDFGKNEKMNGVDIISFQFAPIHMVEIGIYTIYLTLIKGEDRVSPTPIKVRFYDNLSQDDLSFISIIEDLQKEIERMQLEVAKGINISEIGAPNGVASLDSKKKIPDTQMPKYATDHLEAIMRSDNGAHGFRITPNGIALYKDNDGAWNNVIFADKPVGGGLPPHTPPTISISEGTVTVKFPDGDLPTVQKWDAGEKDVQWFTANGFPFVGSGFQVTIVGTYTFYYKLQDGREFVAVFAVTEAQLPAKEESKKPIKDIEKGTVIKIGNYYWQILEPSSGFLWFADEYPVRLATPYDGDVPRERRTRDYNVNKTSHAAYKLNNDFMQLLDTTFRDAIQSKSWNNGPESSESSSKVNAKVGLFTLSEWNKYKGILKYMKPQAWEKWSYTMTKSDSDELSIMQYSDGSINPAQFDTYDVFQYTNSEGVNNTADARPVVYVDPNFEVDYTSEEEATLEPIDTFNEGDTVKFAGINWILIDKATRKLVARDPVSVKNFDIATTQNATFDPARVGNLAHWLNNDFYASLPSATKSKIVSTSWDTRLDPSDTGRINPIIEAKVGLMTVKDITDKKSVLNHFIGANNSWLLTYGNTQYSGTALSINAQTGDYNYIVNWRLDMVFNVNPVIHLTKDTKVARVKFSNVAVSTLDVGNYVNIGGFEWVHMGDGVFAMSKVLTTGKFAESEEGDTTFNLNSGIGKASADVKFNLYLRDRGKLKMTPVLSGRPTDTKTVYTDIFGIHYNNWINGYKDIAMKYFRDDVQYWLMSNTNSLYLAFAYYRESPENNLISSKLTETKGIRPVIKLDMATLVETEDNIDRNGYAHIPDSNLRVILNKALGKGDDNTAKITIQEMYTITSIDTFSLGRVTDLTGIELLVNCKNFKASFSLKNDEYNKVNFTDVTPFIQLGKSKTLISFNLYGVDDVVANAVLHNLKGKFPTIESGNVKFNDKVWIDTWELKGVLDRPQFIRERTGYAYTNGGDEAGMYSMMLRVIDNSADIVKWKPFNSASYIPWTQGGYPSGEVDIIPKNTVGIVYSQYPFYYDDTTPDGKYTIGFENANGKKSEFHVIVKDHIAYWQYDDEQDIAFASILSDKKFPTTGTYTIPTIINGLNVVEIGNADNPSLDKTLSFRCEKVVIPEEIEKIYSFMPVQRADIEIYVNNPSCEFIKPDKTFISVYKDGTIQYAKLTVYGKPNSTTKKLMESRAQQEQYIYREF